MARKLAIVRPLSFTIPTFSNMTNTGNLLTPDPKEVATQSAGAAAFVDIDLGSSQSIDTFFVGYLSSNVGPVDILYGTSASTTNALVTVAVQSSVLVTPDLHRVYVHTAPVTARHIRFSFPSPGGSAGTLGVLAAGLSVPITWGHEFGAGRPVEDTGNAERLFSGGFGIYEGVRVGGYQWTFGDLFDAEVEQLYALQRALGVTKPVLVVEDPTQSSGLNERTHWGLFDRLETYERQLPGASRYAFKVRDWA
jgi:hypothetical protein